MSAVLSTECPWWSEPALASRVSSFPMVRLGDASVRTKQAQPRRAAGSELSGVLDVVREAFTRQVAPPAHISSALKDFAALSTRLGRMEAATRIAFDSDGEMTIEWRHAGSVTIGSLPGNGTFGYAVLLGETFVPGADFDVNGESSDAIENLRRQITGG